MFNDKRYNQFSAYLKNKFGVKVYKITLDAGFSCPNRDGTISKDGCIFCDEGGSFAQTYSNLLPLDEQLRAGIELQSSRFKAEKFMSYFQAYSNTYKPVKELEKIYNSALNHPDIVGISIGTRPDCLDDEKIKLISSYTKDYETWLELGLQSIHDKTLMKIKRGHDYKCFLNAYEKAKNAGIKVCAHVILGMWETHDEMMQTAQELARIEEETAAAQEKLEQEQAELSRLEEGDRSMNEEMEKARAELDAALLKYEEDSLKASSLNTETENLKSRLIEINNKNITRKAEINTLTNYRQTLIDRKTSLTEEFENRDRSDSENRERLKDIPGIRLLANWNTENCNYAYLPVIFEPKHGCNRNIVYEKLSEERIAARKYFYPLTCDQACFRNKYREENLPIARYLTDNVLALPLYEGLSLEEVDFICDVIKR